jgi:hypothetical protein
VRKLGNVIEHEWIIGYRAHGPSEERLMDLLRHRAFTRARSLVVDDDVELSWEGLEAFCSSPEARKLERLDVNLGLGPHAMLVVLGASSFERLTRLEIGCNFVADPDVRGFDRLAGLPALRSLRLKHGLALEVVSGILGSPLGSRLEEVQAHVLPETLKLPNLRRLLLSDSFVDMKGARALFDAAPELTRLAYLDVSNAGVTSAVAMGFADPQILPSLRRLDISRNPINEMTVMALKKRFGDRLIATDMMEPPQKRSARKPRLRGSAVRAAVEKVTAEKAAAPRKKPTRSRG